MLHDCVLETTGTDVSRIARRRSPRSKITTRSVYEFALPRCDGVTALGEVLSYLPAPPLAPFFGKVHASLSSGGLFIFDVLVSSRGRHMSYRTWRAGADWAVLVDVAETRGYVYRDITTFRRTGGGYRRSHEHHRLRVFPRRQWSGCFGPMAFPSGVSRRYGDLELPPRRLAFIVRKG